MIKIDIILPYKELFSPNGASAVSISVNNSITFSKFKSYINVYGQFVREPFDSCDFIGFKSNKFKYFSNNLSIIKQYLSKTKNDNLNKIIEIHNRPYLFNYLLKKNIKHCLILYFHNDPLSMKGSKSIEERLRILKNASGIVFVSNFLKDKFFEGIDQSFNNIFIIPNSLDKNFKVKNIKKINQVLYVGRIVEEKGVEIYANVVKKLSKKYKDWQFLIIGSTKLGYKSKSSFEKKIIKIVDQSGENFKNLGYITNESTKNIMSKSNILVIPSKWEEPFGITAIEGLANKMMIISAEVGGLTEIILDKGILIKKIDEIKLEKKLEYLIKNPEKIKKYQNLAWKNYLFDQKKVSKLQDNIREKIYNKFYNIS